MKTKMPDEDIERMEADDNVVRPQKRKESEVKNELDSKTKQRNSAN